MISAVQERWMERAMRRLLLVAALFGAVQSAQAADLPDLPILRGAVSEGLSTSRVNWQGYYIGAQAGVGTSDMNFGGSTRNIAAQLLSGTAMEAAGQVSSWPLLGKTSQRGQGWGGFVGYNSQWDDVVIGVEMSYMHGKFGGTQTDSMERSVAGTVFSDGRPRIIQIKGINLEASFAPNLLYVTNQDKPGFIGRLGTLLGTEKVNIANFNLGRAAPGEDAISLIEIDDPVSDAVLAKVGTIEGVVQAKRLRF